MNTPCTHPAERVQRGRCFIGPIAGERPALLNTGLPGRGPKMTIKRKLTSLTTAVALAATTLAPMATSASAEPWRDGSRNGYIHSDRGDFNRCGDRGDWNRDGDSREWDRGCQGGNWDGRGRDGGRHDFYAYRRHKHHDTGKYIAL